MDSTSTYFNRVLSGLREQFLSNSKNLCDVELYCGSDKEPIRCHSLILMGLAPFWNSLFEKYKTLVSHEPFSILLPHLSKSLLSELLFFLYEGASRLLYISLDLAQTFQLSESFSCQESLYENDEDNQSDETEEKERESVTPFPAKYDSHYKSNFNADNAVLLKSSDETFVDTNSSKMEFSRRKQIINIYSVSSISYNKNQSHKRIASKDSLVSDFQTSESLERNTVKNNVSCYICGIIKSNYYAIRLHLLTHNSYSCPSCVFNASGIDSFISHQRSSHGGKIFCLYCESLFSTSHSLKRHLVREHDKAFNSKVRDTSLFSKSPTRKMYGRTQKRQEKEESSFPCYQNDINYDYDSSSFSSSSTSSFERKKPLSDYKINCDLCKKNFKGWRELQRHLTSIHGTCTSFQCRFCSQEFSLASLLINHERQIHYEWNEILTCHGVEDNDQTFSSSSSVDPHLQGKIGKYKETSMTEERMVCEICGKKFPSPYSVKAHNYRVHKVKRLSCSYCSKKFVYENQLKTHINAVHEKNPLFHCTWCTKHFTTKNSFGKHMRRKHGILNKMGI